MFEKDRQAAESVHESFTEAYYAEGHRRLWARRDFYRRAFEEDEQNSIYRYLLELSVKANENALKRMLGVPLLPRERAFEARHFAHGNVGSVVDWLRGSFEATPAQLASFMFSCMPDALRDAYAAQGENAARELKK
jgi:hypothetical protein